MMVSSIRSFTCRRSSYKCSRAYDKHQYRVLRIQHAYKVLDGPMLNDLMTVGANFNVYEEKDGTIEWPSLLGPDKIKLLKNLPDNLVGCQPENMVQPTQKLWKDCA